MIVGVGSTNQVKVAAVGNVLRSLADFQETKILSHSVPSQVSEQPMSYPEILLGAKNRAMNAFKACAPCDFGVGLESGLFQVAGTETGYFNVCICAIYDGSRFYCGASTAFEVPGAIIKLVLEKGVDLSKACFLSGITSSTQVGAEEGLIGILSRGRMNRETYTMECVHTAWMQLLNPKWY